MHRRTASFGRAGFFAPALAGCLGALLVVGCLGLAACEQEPSAAGELASVYEQRPSEDAEGTDRFYMGREIARVLGHVGADWMERPTRETAELPGRVIQALELKPSDVVADIGAGTGYFTFRLSPKVPYGTVYAVDIQPEMLEIIRERIRALEAHNVAPVLGTPVDPHLPPNSVDVALIVDSYHEFSHPREMATQLKQALKPGGRLVLVEYRGEDPTLPVAPLHRMTEAQARREMEAVGLQWRETRDILPQQHFMVFQKPVE